MDRTELEANLSKALTRAQEAGDLLSRRGGELGRHLADEVGSIEWQQLWPNARRTLGLGAGLALARQAGQAAVHNSRRHPAAAAAVVAVVAGAGVALWMRWRQTRTVGIAPRSGAKSTAGGKKATPRKKAARKRAPARKRSSRSGNSVQPSA